jgi:DNA polymerase-3 subunit alpha
MSYTTKLHLKNILTKSVLFFDLETSGLVKNLKYDAKSESNYPDFKSSEYNAARIIQIGWLHQTNFNSNKQIEPNDISELIIKPSGFEITNSHIHGITQEHAVLTGLDIKSGLDLFAKIIEESDYILGYNVYFDINILLSELYRLNLHKTIEKILQLKKQECILCVGELSGKYIKFNNWKKFKKYQIPSQKLTYETIFEKSIENAHNAKYDVAAMIQITQHICSLPDIPDPPNHNLVKSKPDPELEALDAELESLQK